ncbi:MAG: oligosaccharide flippase family protein [Clostridia bacterium]|nr:oligosaccharide flippase family protein [Clostridia bacterium]
MKKSHVQNTALTASAVTALSVAERGLGFLYRIALSRLIGAEGLGLYQVALSLFSLFLTIGTGGIPITVSRMISKSKAEKRPFDEPRAVSAGVALSLLLTLPACLILIPFGGKLGFLFTDDRAFGVFRILMLGLCFSSLYAVFRGSFWGNQQFLLPSILEIAEESVMVIAGVLLLNNVSSPAIGAQKAAWAVVISYLFSFSASLVCFLVRGGRFTHPQKMLKPLFNATLPITSVRASGSLVNSAVAVLLPIMLMRAGLESGEALTLFGIVSGMVMPILFIPSTVIGSLALVLVPQLSEDFYRKNYLRLQTNIKRGLKFSFLLACILIPFFHTLGKDLGALAFSNEKAGEMIAACSPILLPMSLTMISTSMLNSMGFEKQTFLFYFVGAAAMMISILALPSVCGIYAYMIGLGASFALTALCNLIFLKKQWKGSRQVRVHGIVSPLLFILPISLFGRIVEGLFSTCMSELLSLTLNAILMSIFTLLLYILSGLLPFNVIKSKLSLIFGKRKVKKNNFFSLSP